MKRFLLSWLVPGLLLFVEAGVQGWRRMDYAASEGAVFNWRGAELVSNAPGSFGQALEMYRADRGCQKQWKLGQGRSVDLFYFEWDLMETGPFADIDGHEAEVCNVAAGYKLVHTGGLRTYQAVGRDKLVFRETVMETPGGGGLVYVFKLPWIQGIGEWQGGSANDRGLRLKRSFIRHKGEARVLEVGIFGAGSEEEAWNLVISEVLEKLDWQAAGR